MVVAVVGWAGAVLVVAVYAATAAGRGRGDQRWCLVANLAGAAGLVVSCAASAAWPSAALNVAWAGAAVVGLTRAGRRRAGRRPASSGDHPPRHLHASEGVGG